MSRTRIQTPIRDTISEDLEMILKNPRALQELNRILDERPADVQRTSNQSNVSHSPQIAAPR